MNSSVMRRLAGSRWQPPMMDNLGCFALMLEGESQAACMCSAISSEEVVIVSSRWPQKAEVSGVALPWRDSVKLSCARMPGTPSHAPRGKPALMKLISMLTLSPETIRKKGSEAVAAATVAPE
jgi:hypothetical protein